MEGKEKKNKVTCTLRSEYMISRCMMNSKKGAKVYEGDNIAQDSWISFDLGNVFIILFLLLLLIILVFFLRSAAYVRAAVHTSIMW